MKQTRPCLTDEELLAIIEGTNAPDEAEHLIECERCSRSRKLLGELIRSCGSADSADEALARVKQLGRYTAARIEAVQPHQWRYAASRYGVSPSVALALLDRFETLMDTASLDAVSMAEAAITVAEMVRGLADDDGASLRSRAWKAKAVALASFASYEAAIEALAEGERAARDEADVAALTYAKAWLYANPDVWRPDEAVEIIESRLALLQRVAPERARAALLLRVVIMLRRGDFATGEAELQRLATIFDSTGERTSIAINLAHCRLQQGDPAAGLRYGREAASLSRTLGSAGTVRLWRSEWMIARALGDLGDPESGLVIARRIADEFTRAHMDEEAVHAELTCVRLLLSSNPVADVRAGCERILQLCARWPGPRSAYAAEALQYLRDVAARRVATFDDLDSVEGYVHDLRTANPVRFRPPMPLIVM